MSTTTATGIPATTTRDSKANTGTDRAIQVQKRHGADWPVSASCTSVNAHTAIRRWSNLGVSVAGGCIATLGLLVIGASFHNETIAGLFGAVIPQQYNSILGLTIVGLGLVGIAFGHWRVATTCAVAAIMTGSFILVRSAFGLEAIPARLLAQREIAGASALSPMIGMCLVVAGVALMFLQDSKRLAPYQALLALIGSMSCTAGVIGMLLQVSIVKNVYDWEYLTRLAVLMTGLLAVAGTAVVVFTWRRGKAEDSNAPYWLSILVSVGAFIAMLCLWQAMLTAQRHEIGSSATLPEQALVVGLLLASLLALQVQFARSVRRRAQELAAANRKLAGEITERERAQAALEERERSLSAANKELEAFSYSVSHDLRAPLRAMDGFSQALLEDCAESLDETGKGYLSRIRAAAQRMGDLIDALLQLSRVSRSELKLEQINLSEIAQAAVADLRQSEPGRQVDFVCDCTPAVHGDRRLLRAALNNLLENAWKFTRKAESSRIEFGAVAQGGGRTYYVRDSGVGFDMAYAVKLFGAFQRLHPVTEFPGTGIGLATVQRIIQRHGGQIWAESSINQGATFFFTLAGRESHGETEDSAGRRQS